LVGALKWVQYRVYFIGSVSDRLKKYMMIEKGGREIHVIFEEIDFKFF